MQFPTEVSADAHRRLRRIEGQVRGIQRLVDEGADCRDVITQIAAARAALDRVGFKLMAAGIHECALAEAAGAEPELDRAALEKLFLSLG